MATGTGTSTLSFAAAAVGDSRFSFTSQYLVASAMFARECAEIEKAHPDAAPENVKTRHRGLVTAAIMQSCAAVEAESAELIMYGPWHHLGSDKADHKSVKLIQPLADFIDHQDSLDRYQIIIHLLTKAMMPTNQNPWQDMATLVKVRNELVHYKSKWGQSMDRSSLFTDRLPQLKLKKPPFVDEKHHFFPHKFLSAACASWATGTAVTFILDFYGRLGIPNPLNPHMEHFKDL